MAGKRHGMAVIVAGIVNRLDLGKAEEAYDEQAEPSYERKCEQPPPLSCDGGADC
jgi:hypothetical protein